MLSTCLAAEEYVMGNIKHDVYLMQNNSVMHWSSLLRRSKEVLNVAKPIIPTLKHSGLAHPISRVQISTMVVKENWLVAGGFHGELICKNFNHSEVAFCSKITTDDNAISNVVDVFCNPSFIILTWLVFNSILSCQWVVAKNNDSQIRVFDSENFAYLGCLKYDWSVNNASVSPDGKLLVVLGDNIEGLIADANTGKHPNRQILATENQDRTWRLWDIRNLSESLEVLKERICAIRGLRFTSDGRFLDMVESVNFVHIFDSQSGYPHSQEIDIFGEISSISFIPGKEALFVGVADRM
ncbi:hypothetical protein RYX36_003394 [Vicia faba]